MNSTKSTKRALLASLLALVVSISMLIGSTFAWFTDKVSTSVNTIQAGTLDVDLEMKDENGEWVDAEGKTLNWVTTDEVENVLWEPGCTYKLPELRVKNNGDLALKYQIVITGLTGDAELLEVITFTYNGMPDEGVYHLLAAGEDSGAFVIEGHMDEAAGNKYMGKKIENIAITLYATQLNSEADSYGPDYDEDAVYADEWDGTADFALFGLPRNASAEEISNVELDDNVYIITTSEELAAFAKLVDAGNTFEGKTVKLNNDIDLFVKDKNGEAVPFDPIGSYRKEVPFKGIFDGQGHAIKNLSQNTWALDNGYSYGDLGLGLFGYVEDATIQNLNMDGANISGESAIVGIVAAAAYGDCTFENITVTNSKGADYQYYAGGVVGWASGTHSYINCDVDASTTIAAQWGDFDNSTGGIIGGAGGSAEIFMKNCDVACRIDAYNDVTSSYQWYAYRRCGMLIGNPGKTVNKDGTTYADAPQLTCENVIVTYGDWANYTYCEFAGTSWPYVRVQAGVSNSAYSNPRYGHPTDANGNEVVDDNHVHNEGEDHFILCEFDQLYGGGQGVYGTAAHDGVTVIYNNK